MNQAPITRPKLTTEQLAERLTLLKQTLAAHKPAPKEKKPKPAKSPELVCNTLAERFALEATGYKVWRAIAKVVILEERRCSCGAVHLEWRDELYELENGLSHSVWLRHEGYGIEHQEDLPIRTEIWPMPRNVSGCVECFNTELIESSLGNSPQHTFPF